MHFEFLVWPRFCGNIQGQLLFCWLFGGLKPVLCFFFFAGWSWNILFHCVFLPSEATWAQTRWCTWLTRASARGRGPSISKPGPFYAACATCQVMNCSSSCLPKQPCKIRLLTVMSSVLCLTQSFLLDNEHKHRRKTQYNREALYICQVFLIISYATYCPVKIIYGFFFMGSCLRPRSCLCDAKYSWGWWMSAGDQASLDHDRSRIPETYEDFRDLLSRRSRKSSYVSERHYDFIGQQIGATWLTREAS